MREPHFQVTAVLLPLALALGVGQSVASPDEIPVDVLGYVGAVPMVPGSHTVNAGLSTSIDLDTYTFNGVAGDELSFRLQGRTLDLDPTAMVRRPNGSVLTSAGCAADRFSTCSFAMAVVLDETGVFTINVSDLGLDNAGPYQFHLETYPPVYNWVGIRYADPVQEALGHSTDIDSYAFNGVAGTGVRVGLAGLSLDLDPYMEVWSPTGEPVFSSGCVADRFSTCQFAADLTLTATGIYRVALLENGADNSGSYRIQTSCQFGACPLPTDPAPVPIPEPTTWAMLLGGIAGLLLWRRRELHGFRHSQVELDGAKGRA